MHKVIKETIEEHMLKDMARVAEMVEAGELSTTAAKQVLKTLFTEERPMYLAYLRGELDA